MVTNLNNAIDLFDAIFSNLADELNFYTSNSPVYAGSFPPMNVFINEESKDLLLEFAVAGIPKDNIDLSIEGDYLFLEIQKCDKEIEKFTIVQKGIKTSNVKRKFYVPMSHYQLDELKITLTDGILEVAIPAKEEMRPKKFEIK